MRREVPFVLLGVIGLLGSAWVLMFAARPAERSAPPAPEETVTVPEAPAMPDVWEQPPRSSDPIILSAPPEVPLGAPSVPVIAQTPIRADNRRELRELQGRLDAAQERIDALQSASDDFSKANAVVARLEDARIVFSTPVQLNIDESGRAKLELSFEQSFAEMAKTMPSLGRIEADVVKASPRMKAELIGESFSIEPTLPEEQLVTKTDGGHWVWLIKPKRSGPLTLDLTLTAIVDLGHSSVRKLLRTYDRQIVVDVTTWQRAGAFLSDNWQWMWGGLFLPGIPLLWRRVRKRQRSILIGTPYIPRAATRQNARR